MHSTIISQTKMSDRDDSFAEEMQSPSSSPWLTTTLLDSLKISLRNKHVFFPIFVFLTLPLSFLIFSLTLSSRSLKARIYHLEAVASFARTRFEARHVLKESRDEAISLLRLKSVFFLPSFLLSFLASISAVTSAALSYHGHRPSILTALASVKPTWKRVSVTVIIVYALLLLYAQVPIFLANVFSSGPESRLLILVIGSGCDVYLMAVMSLALVVSVLEEKFGWDAIRVGWGLMEGRRIAGWLLSGSFVLLSGFIGYRLEESIENQVSSTLSSSWWTVVIGEWDRVVLVCLYGVDVLWCSVVTTVFYCESKKRHVIIRGGENESFGTV